MEGAYIGTMGAQRLDGFPIRQAPQRPLGTHLTKQRVFVLQPPTGLWSWMRRLQHHNEHRTRREVAPGTTPLRHETNSPCSRRVSSRSGRSMTAEASMFRPSCSARSHAILGPPMCRHRAHGTRRASELKCTNHQMRVKWGDSFADPFTWGRSASGVSAAVLHQM